MTLPNEDPLTEARRANARIDSHEDVCAERYKRIDETLKRLERAGEDRRNSIRGIYKQQWAIMGGIVVLLLAVVGYLLDRQIPPIAFPP